jgi:hypothetical protein
MLVHQMLMALFLGIGNLRFHPRSCMISLGPKMASSKMVMTVDAGGIFDQVGIVDIPPTDHHHGYEGCSRWCG